MDVNTKTADEQRTQLEIDRVCGGLPNSTKIAGTCTVKHWKDLRINLIKNLRNPDKSKRQEDWNTAFEIFKCRVETRFLKPIDMIIEGGSNQGEGFAVVALQCMLIEFFEAFFQGKIYNPKKPNDTQLTKEAEALNVTKEDLKKHLQPFEYNSSAKLIKDFVRKHSPFKESFNSDLAKGFYENIRCGLLHEAATKESSLIREKEGSKLIEKIDNDNMIVYRTTFQEALKAFLTDYKKELLDSEVLKTNFIRKMDGLCQIKRVFYFAYGSNLKESRLMERINIIHTSRRGYLPKYDFRFNKKGCDGSSKANIVGEANAKVWGVCYEIDCEGMKKLENIEKGYFLKKVAIAIDEEAKSDGFIVAETFLSDELTDNRPNKDYLDIILEGAREKELPESYISEIKQKVL